jgi:hypothetical protein
MASTTIDLTTGLTTLTKPNGDFIASVESGDPANYTLTFGTTVGGSGNRQITLGSGNNTLTLNGGTDQVAAINGNNSVSATGAGAAAITVGSGNNTLDLHLSDGPDVITAGNGKNTITTGLGSSQITVGSGFDSITTFGGNNTITVTLPATAPVTPDAIHGNSANTPVGGNTLVVATAGTFNSSQVDGIETYRLANGAANTLNLVDSNFADLPATPTITVFTGDSGGSVTAATLSTGHNLIVHAGAGTGLLAGGSGTNTAIFVGPSSNYAINRVNGVVQSVQSTQGPNTADTFTGVWNVLFVPPAPIALALATASDSGISNSDGITNVTLPVITGTGTDGDTVTLFDGSTNIGTGVVSGGIWSITATSPLTVGPNVITATQADTFGNISAPSTALNVTLDPSLPNVTAALVANSLDTHSGGIIFSQNVAGGGDPNATVTISEDGNAIATTQADATGTWGFDPSALAQGSHTLVASETNTAGNTGSTLPVMSPNLRFLATDVTTSTSGSLDGINYTGPVSYLQSEYAYTGSDNVVISANVANAFIHGGAAEEALAAKAGSNVLMGGAGSSWLVGATGADGGTDTFFVDNRGGQTTWDTLLNFHAGDALTLWGFNAASGATTFEDNKGAAGYQGETLHASLGNGTAASALVTFAGLSSASTQFTTSTGTANGIDYLSVTRIA